MSHDAGFTLLELLITLAIIAILLSLTTMGLQSFFLKNQHTASVNQLLNALSFARHSAITRHMPVSLCPTIDKKTCHNEWNQGYMVFLYRTSINPVNAKDILAVYSRTTDTLNITNSRALITFQANGQSPASNSTFIFSTSHTEPAITTKIILNNSGRVTLDYIK